MKKTNIIICDVCKEKIAKRKCDLCGIDLCSNYECGIKINVGIGNIVINYITFCRVCEKKARNLKILDEGNKIKKIIIERVKKNLILKNLEDEKKN